MLVRESEDGSYCLLKVRSWPVRENLVMLRRVGIVKVLID